MIAALTGELVQVDEGRAYVRAGAMLFEVFVPAIDVAELAMSVGQTLTFHTIFYLQGDASGGSSEPRLVGFLRTDDKRFFERFITVKGIGPRKALRALAEPVGQIALAIEERDARFLTRLPEIGKRTAEQVIAELAGKVAEFAVAARAGVGQTLKGAGAATRKPAAEEDAIAALMALGERRPDAEALLERARAAAPDARTTDALVREMLRQRTSRS